MAKAKQTFDALYTAIEEVKDKSGNLIDTVLYNLRGEPSVIIEISNTAQQYCADTEAYYAYLDTFNNIISSLGEGYLLQKQDIFAKQAYHHTITDDMEYLSQSYFRYFNGREYTETRTFIIITQEVKKSRFIQYDSKKEKDFHSKVEKVTSVLHDKHINYKKLNKKEIEEYVYRFLAFNYKKEPYSLSNIKASGDYLRYGKRVVKSFSVINIDEVDLPPYLTPCGELDINGFKLATDLLNFLPDIPNTDLIIYNQVIQIPQQRQLLRKLQAKAKRHHSLPDASNKIAEANILAVLDHVAIESKLLVNCNFNIITSCPEDKIGQVKSFIETKFYDRGILISQNTFNQLELFTASFPGNSFALNPQYDLFLTLSETALCLFYKEHPKQSEDTPLTTYYTDRTGVPVAIDITGKEGKNRYTDNANFFCIGPSGSGKSFHMNSVVRQLLEQNTEVIMVDTGDSYEGICRYFKGTYITYSKEKPISMNPFKVTDIEYNENFGEKKQFLKSLIFLIYKGDSLPTKVEEALIDKIIVEYYDAYFHPFNTYSEEERKDLRKKLLLEDKKNGKYEDYADPLEDALIEKFETENIDQNIAEKQHSRTKAERQIDKLHQVISDEASSQGEKDNANHLIMQLMPKVIEDHYLIKIEQRIDKLEHQKQKLKVKELSFNSFYEYCLERIPQIVKNQKVEFDIHSFAVILERFYKGGELQDTLNNDVDSSLFDEQFIVFEIDKIKDDPILFPIVVLIIMDVFIQKMRIKKGRKALIIEEAWKAISSPTMAEYIKYLYKTVRKFHGIAGVVTQELNDVIDSPIVKEAIINNSDVKILLDQSKFKERYDDIAAIMGLTPVQRKQIFTINALDNKENRNFFKEVWICRGLNSDVYGVEEPPECYWAYTTERAEKEALKIYEKRYGNIQSAIEHIEKDRKQIGIKRYLDFAVQINHHQSTYDLWKD